jgi:hypothetical protein
VAVTAVRRGCGGRLSSGCVRERLRVHLSGEHQRRPYRQTTCSCLSLTTRVVTETGPPADWSGLTAATPESGSRANSPKTPATN